MKLLVLVLVGLGLAWFGHSALSDLMFWGGITLMGIGVALAVNWANFSLLWFTDFFGGDSGDGGGGD